MKEEMFRDSRAIDISYNREETTSDVLTYFKEKPITKILENSIKTNNYREFRVISKLYII